MYRYEHDVTSVKFVLQRFGIWKNTLMDPAALSGVSTKSREAGQ